MNLWLIGALALLPGFAPCFWLGFAGRTVDRVVAAQLGTVLTSLVLLLVGAGEQRSFFADMSLTLVLLSFPGTLVFARFLERWL